MPAGHDETPNVLSGRFTDVSVGQAANAAAGSSRTAASRASVRRIEVIMTDLARGARLWWRRRPRGRGTRAVDGRGPRGDHRIAGGRGEGLVRRAAAGAGGRCGDARRDGLAGVKKPASHCREAGWS